MPFRRSLRVVAVVALALALLVGVLLWWLWPPERERPWLVLMYVCADEPDYTEEFFLDELRNEVLTVQELQNVTVALLVDRHPGTDTAAIDGESGAADWTQGRLFTLAADKRLVEHQPEFLRALPDAEPDMGDTSTLAAFVDYAVDQWGKDRSVALFLCGHGVGAQWVCEDGTAANDSLTLTEVRDAIRPKHRFEAVVFYACNMATIEAMELLAGRTRLVVASQDVIDVERGLDLTVLRGLDGKWKATPFAERLTEGYFAGGTGDAQGWKTLSTTNTTSSRRWFDFRSPYRRLSGAFEAFAAELRTRLGDPARRDATKAAVLAAADDAEAFGAETGFEGSARLLDLSDFASLVGARVDGVAEHARRLADAIGDVSASRSGTDHPRAHGVSVLFAAPLQSGDEAYYRDLGVCSTWLDVLISLRDESVEPVVYAATEETEPPPGDESSWEADWAGPGPSGAWFVCRPATGRGYEMVVPAFRAPGRAATRWDGKVPWTESGATRALFPFTRARFVDPAAGSVVAVAPASLERASGGAPIPVSLEWRLTLTSGSVAPKTATFVRCVGQGARGARWIVPLAAGDRLRPVRPRILAGSGTWRVGDVSATGPSVVVGPAGAASLRLAPAPLPPGAWEGGFLLPFAPPGTTVRRAGKVVAPGPQRFE